MTKESYDKIVSVAAARNVSLCVTFCVDACLVVLLLLMLFFRFHRKYLFACSCIASIRFPFIIFCSLFVLRHTFLSFCARNDMKKTLYRKQHRFILCDAIIVASFWKLLPFSNQKVEIYRWYRCVWWKCVERAQHTRKRIPLEYDLRLRELAFVLRITMQQIRK